VSEDLCPAIVVVLLGDLSEILEVDASLSDCFSCEAELVASTPPEALGLVPFFLPFLVAPSV